MTEIKQRLAIARWLGWKRLPKDPEMIQYTAEMPNGKWSLIPDYPQDLNAMHEAEEELIKRNLFQDYWPRLDKGAPGQMARATAAERAEALLKTLNLWIND